MYCKVCGNKLSPNDNFCEACGKNLEDNFSFSSENNKATEEQEGNCSICGFDLNNEKKQVNQKKIVSLIFRSLGLYLFVKISFSYPKLIMSDFKSPYIVFFTGTIVFTAAIFFSLYLIKTGFPKVTNFMLKKYNEIKEDVKI
ncbi:MAG: zinc-ribbon domain-containing protein [Desulfobacterales bacterium]|nr:zinc-ribbon domain-containing protein [Desulfobacterales bacterium]